MHSGVLVNGGQATTSMGQAVCRIRSFLTMLICVSFAAAILAVRLINSILAGQ